MKQLKHFVKDHYSKDNSSNGYFDCPKCKGKVHYTDGDYCPHCKKKIGFSLRL